MQATPTNRNRWLLGLGAVVAVLAVVVAALVLSGDDDGDDVDTAGSTTTTQGDGSTTSTTEGTTTTTAPPVDPEPTVFPDPLTSRRFESPQALVHSFATELLGYGNPVVGELQQGDARSGEIELRPRPDGPMTVVMVRQLEDDTWFVLGAAIETIQVVSPEAGGTLTSPTALSGAALAYEGTVDVRLFADGTPEPIGRTYVTGRGDGVIGAFTGELTFEVPEGAKHGVLIFTEASGEDGATNAATAIRVHF